MTQKLCLIAHNDQQLKGCLAMLSSQHETNFSFDVIFELVKMIKLNNRLNHHFIIVNQKIANELPN